jgi:hypothetical protein
MKYQEYYKREVHLVKQYFEKSKIIAKNISSIVRPKYEDYTKLKE